jgi:2'-5' RNA ligase
MRCFVAVWPAPDIVEALEALPRPETPGLRWSSREQWHVTLRFLGDIDAQAVTDVSAMLARAADSAVGAPRADGGPGTRFLGPGLLIWPVDGLTEVANEVERLTDTFGKPPPSRSFYGHVTLAGSPGRRSPPLTTLGDVTGVVLDRHLLDPRRERATPRRGPLPGAGGVPVPGFATSV